MNAILFREVLKPLAQALGPAGDLVLGAVAERRVRSPRPMTEDARTAQIRSLLADGEERSPAAVQRMLRKQDLGRFDR